MPGQGAGVTSKHYSGDRASPLLLPTPRLRLSPRLERGAGAVEVTQHRAPARRRDADRDVLARLLGGDADRAELAAAVFLRVVRIADRLSGLRAVPEHLTAAARPGLGPGAGAGLLIHDGPPS